MNAYVSGKRQYTREYRISRAILVILALVITLVITRHEDVSVVIFFTVIFTASVFLLSFPAAFISRKMIAFGDGIKNMALRILYYIAIPVVSLALAFGIYGLMQLYDDSLHASGWSPSTLSEGLGYAVTFVTVGAILSIAVFLPYIQTLIVLILRKISKRA